MTSNERCVHFSKFRNKTFKTNMDVVFIWKTWCVFKWHRTKVVCTFANFASFSQNEHGCRIFLKNVVYFQMTSDESVCQHFQNEHGPKQCACSAGWFEKEGVVPRGCHMFWSSRYVRSWFTESFMTAGQESERRAKNARVHIWGEKSISDTVAPPLQTTPAGELMEWRHLLWFTNAYTIYPPPWFTVHIWHADCSCRVYYFLVIIAQNISWTPTIHIWYPRRNIAYS